jgi:hypothetical protein
MIDPKTALARDRLGERRDSRLVEVLDRPARGADQVMVMARLTPDVGRDVSRSLQPLRQASGHEGVE